MGILVLSIVSVSLVTSLAGVLLSLMFNSFKARIAIKVKYFLWVGMLVSLLLPFRPQIGQGVIQLTSQEILSNLPKEQQDALSVEMARQGSNFGSWDLSWLQLVLGIWLLGVLLSLGFQAYHWWNLRRLIGRWAQAVTDQTVLDSLSGAQELLAITRPIKVSYYPLTQTPMLVGLVNPHILLPEENYTDDELDLIFEHELTHFKHRDAYVNLLSMLVISLHWFNPLVRFMVKEMQEIAESYCDHDVLVYQDKSYRTFYGETLISMINRSRQPRLGLSSCFYSNKFKLKRRMEAILNTQSSTKGMGGLAVVLVSLSLFFSGSVFAWVEQSDLVEEQPNLRAFPVLDKEPLEAAVLKRLGFKSSEIKILEMTEDQASYYIRLERQDQLLFYVLDKATGNLVLTDRKDMVRSTSGSASSQASVSKSRSSIQASSTGASVTSSDQITERASQSESQQASQPAQVSAAPSPELSATVNQAPVAAPVVAEPTAPPVYTPSVYTPSEIQFPAAAVIPVAPAAPVFEPADTDDDWDDDNDDDD